MAIHGGIAEFDSASEDGLAYTERLDQYFIANGVDDTGKQRAILLSSCAEKNYSQLDKEGLAIIFGVEKFHNFLFGRQFTIFTDHKPVKHLFGEDKPIPPMASARLQRWALKLSAYQYKIAHNPGKDNANAYVLSRLPLPEYPMEVT
ncbi:hypothetical protein EMCRGX_G001496 [Ephydatia muelleri]